MEAQRKALTIATKGTLYAFLPHTSEAFRQQVDWLLASDRSALAAAITWQDVVELAKRQQYSLRWSTAPARGLPPPVAPPRVAPSETLTAPLHLPGPPPL